MITQESKFNSGSDLAYVFENPYEATLAHHSGLRFHSKLDRPLVFPGRSKCKFRYRIILRSYFLDKPWIDNGLILDALKPQTLNHKP